MGPGFGYIALLDNMGYRFGESEDGLLRMPWPRFCARWALLFKEGRERRDEERRREEERAAEDERRREEREWAELRSAHQRHIGGGGGM